MAADTRDGKGPPRKGALAWAGESRVEAGGTWARVSNAIEIGMGAPTTGSLTTNRGFERDGVSPAVALSPDGTRLAFTEIRSRSERREDERGVVRSTRAVEFTVHVRDLERGTTLLTFGPRPFAAIESFDGHTLVVLDAHATGPTRVVIDVDEPGPAK